MRFHTTIFLNRADKHIIFFFFFYVSIICFICANYMVISDKFVERIKKYIFTCRNPKETPMTTSVRICVLNRFFSEENVKSWRFVFIVILTTMSNTFTYFVDRSVLIFFGFSSLKIDC